MIKIENKIMIFFRRLRLDSVAWSLRRLYCPVEEKDLVLEVGSGGNPFYRSNILCDAYLDTGERHYDPLINDRPTVLAFVENLPFKDSSFDFVIACHVLEHSKDPEKFLSEIQRVAKAGYIEVPHAFLERLTNYDAHRLEIYDENDCLYIKKKPGKTTDKELEKLFEKSKVVFPDWMSSFPFNFHVRYYWSKEQGGIKYKIINPEYNFDWDPGEEPRFSGKLSFKIKIKQKILELTRKLLSQNQRNKNLNIFDYLQCNKCKSDKLSKTVDGVVCKKCGAVFPLIDDKIIDFTKN